MYNLAMEKVKLSTILKRYWSFLTPYKGMWFALIFFAAASYTLDLFSPWYYKKFFDVLASGGTQDPGVVSKLIGFLVIILVVNGVRWASYRVSGFLEPYFITRLTSDVDQASFANILDHSYTFFTNNFAGSLTRKIKRFSSSFETLNDVLLWHLMPIAILSVGSLTVLFRRHVMLGTVMLVCVILIIVGNYFFAIWKLKFDEQRAAKDSEVSGALTDALANSVNVKMFTGKKHEMDLFGKLRDEFRKAQNRSWYLAESSFAFQALIMVVVEFLVMYVAVGLWRQGVVTIGDFALLQGYLLALFDHIWSVGRVMRMAYEALADAKEMAVIYETPFGVMDVRGSKKLRLSKGRVRFENVIFNYNSTRKTLDGFNLDVAPGERVALVGPSGAGKSTTVKLLMRYHDLDSGTISIDGQDISKVTQESLRACIGFVPQDPVLFHRTLMDNIRYGKRGATDKEVIQASRMAHCHEFISDLPETYQTYVGERGIKLSGGERQRVAMARAMLKNAPILVLDEATSSLDSESELRIQEALRVLMRGRTVIVIAHRLSTIMQMDRIVVMDHGRIVDQGTHQELLQREGLYKNLWNIQAGGFMP